jgi:hypothetical protein
MPVVLIEGASVGALVRLEDDFPDADNLRSLEDREGRDDEGRDLSL